MCNLAKTPVNRKVPGIATNILRNIILIHGNLCYLRLLSNSSLAKTWLSTRKRISRAFKFSTSTSMVECSLKGSIDGEPKSLDLDDKTWNRGKCGDIRTYIHAYLHPSSKADGIGHRQPSLVTYATRISLLRSVLASQRLYGSLFEGLVTSAEQVIWQSFDRCKKGKCKLAHGNNSTLQERMS